MIKEKTQTTKDATIELWRGQWTNEMYLHQKPFWRVIGKDKQTGEIGLITTSYKTKAAALKQFDKIVKNHS